MPFPAIWEAFCRKIFSVRYAPTDGGATLRCFPPPPKQKILRTALITTLLNLVHFHTKDFPISSRSVNGQFVVMITNLMTCSIYSHVITAEVISEGNLATQGVMERNLEYCHKSIYVSVSMCVRGGGGGGIISRVREKELLCMGKLETFNILL